MWHSLVGRRPGDDNPERICSGCRRKSFEFFEVQQQSRRVRGRKVHAQTAEQAVRHADARSDCGSRLRLAQLDDQPVRAAVFFVLRTRIDAPGYGSVKVERNLYETIAVSPLHLGERRGSSPFGQHGGQFPG